MAGIYWQHGQLSLWFYRSRIKGFLAKSTQPIFSLGTGLAPFHGEPEIQSPKIAAKLDIVLCVMRATNLEKPKMKFYTETSREQSR